MSLEHHINVAILFRKFATLVSLKVPSGNHRSLNIFFNQIFFGNDGLKRRRRDVDLGPLFSAADVDPASTMEENLRAIVEEVERRNT